MNELMIVILWMLEFSIWLGEIVIKAWLHITILAALVLLFCIWRKLIDIHETQQR